MRRVIGLTVVTLLLGACFPWQAGEDPAGVRLKARASAVAVAIQRYDHDHRRFPTSLQQLVPLYLAALPSEPKFHYDTKHGFLSFTYSPTWPQGGQVSCSCKLGSTEFQCGGYL